MDDLTKEELLDIKHAVKYFMRRHISINNPRYTEFELILEKLESINENLPGYSGRRFGPETVCDRPDRWSYDESDTDSKVRPRT